MLVLTLYRMVALLIRLPMLHVIVDPVLQVSFIESFPLELAYLCVEKRCIWAQRKRAVASKNYNICSARLGSMRKFLTNQR